MNLQHLNDECLLDDTKRLVRQERELLTTILHHLREIERRRLFDNHPSVFAYATKALGYSEDQAYRRISAMRLLTELPEIEEKIESGEINLTHVGLAQSLFKSEAFTPAEKLEVFEAMAGQSTREAQKTATSFASEPIKFRETVRPLGDGLNAVTLQLDDEALAEIEKLKGLLAHQHPDLSFGDLYDLLIKLGLEQLDPARPPQRKTKSDSKAAISRQVWARDEGACVHCKSTYAVQEDHITPASMGGGYTLDNIRLLCRSCNQRAAIEKLGVDKMNPYLSPEGPKAWVRH